MVLRYGIVSRIVSEYFLQGDILGYIKRDIFNLLIRYLKYLKRSLADYKERIDNLDKIS